MLCGEYVRRFGFCIQKRGHAFGERNFRRPCRHRSEEIQGWRVLCQVRSNLENEDVIIVQTTYPDENIIETILIRDAVRDFNPDKIILVVPYYGYARQDRKFQDGEAVSARAIAEILSTD
ncbi:MAG: hypothetical protein FE037_03105 [Thermoplasmata archaeon]|nr:MAG: hypothetical protein FE037_03105 [Thermoplasmata archaeon]